LITTPAATAAEKVASPTTTTAASTTSAIGVLTSSNGQQTLLSSSQPSQPSPLANGSDSNATLSTTATPIPAVPSPMEIDEKPLSSSSSANNLTAEIAPVADASTSVTATETSAVTTADVVTPPPSKKRKVVRFRADHDLVSIRLIEPRGFFAEEEENNEDHEAAAAAGSVGYGTDHLGHRPFLLGVGGHDGGYNEGWGNGSSRWNASLSSLHGYNGRSQFMLPEQMIETLVRGDSWAEPRKLLFESGRAERGAKSVEKDVQEKRESETLSVHYRQIAYIPPSPAEPDPEPVSSATTTLPMAVAGLMLGGQTSNGGHSNDTSIWAAISAAVAATKTPTPSSASGVRLLPCFSVQGEKGWI